MGNLRDLLFVIEDGKITEVTPLFWGVSFFVIWCLMSLFYGYTSNNNLNDLFDVFMSSFLTALGATAILFVLSEAFTVLVTVLAVLAFVMGLPALLGRAGMKLGKRMRSELE